MQKFGLENGRDIYVFPQKGRDISLIGSLRGQGLCDFLDPIHS
jgi:hypothetical protein